MKYQKHIFVCTNQRDSSRASCGEQRGMDLVGTFKEEMGKLGLNKTMRVQRAGCFDICEQGPSVVVYPEGIFYGHVKQEDVHEIVKSHLLNNEPVKRLRLNFNS